MSRIGRVRWASWALLAAACGSSHGGSGGTDGGRDAPTAPPPDGSRTGPDGESTPSCPERPEAEGCLALCDAWCAHLEECGAEEPACLESCHDAFRCPGETAGHDEAICGSMVDGWPEDCASACAQVADDWVGYGTRGVECAASPDGGGPDGGTPDGATDGGAGAACEGRSYCDCSGACQPLVDLAGGCFCECEDPFNCSGDSCSCLCGGAEYVGCAPAERCDDTELDCGECGTVMEDGCPVCDPECA